MKVILYKDVPNLGDEGDVKVVADGYARNFLIPRKFAVPYNRATEVELVQKQRAIHRRRAERATDAASLKTRIEAMEMEIMAAAGEQGRLFGSVTSTAVVDYLLSHGINIERKKIELPDGGIRNIGIHNVKIKIYGEQLAELRVNVAPAGAKQPKKGSSGSEAEASLDAKTVEHSEVKVEDAEESKPNEANEEN